MSLIKFERQEEGHLFSRKKRKILNSLNSPMMIWSPSHLKSCRSPKWILKIKHKTI
jgi:hypothetical protein